MIQLQTQLGTPIGPLVFTEDQARAAGVKFFRCTAEDIQSLILKGKLLLKEVSPTQFIDSLKE